jgi:hypothetical protein
VNRENLPLLQTQLEKGELMDFLRLSTSENIYILTLILYIFSQGKSSNPVKWSTSGEEIHVNGINRDTLL